MSTDLDQELTEKIKILTRNNESLRLTLLKQGLSTPNQWQLLHFLHSTLKTLSHQQREHDFEFMVLEEIFGYQLHMAHKILGKIFIYLPYAYFSADTLQNCPMGTAQSWKLIEAQRGTILGPVDLEITSNLDLISINEHIYRNTFVNYNQDTDYRIKNENYNIYILQGPNQQN